MYFAILFGSFHFRINLPFYHWPNLKNQHPFLDYLFRDQTTLHYVEWRIKYSKSMEYCYLWKCILVCVRIFNDFFKYLNCFEWMRMFEQIHIEFSFFWESEASLLSLSILWFFFLFNFFRTNTDWTLSRLTKEKKTFSFSSEQFVRDCSLMVWVIVTKFH